MQAGEIILIIGACASPILAMWNAWQGMRIKELELKYNNLCKNCKYDFTPKDDLEKSSRIPLTNSGKQAS